MNFSSKYAHTHSFRFQKTIDFLKKYISKDQEILDLGIDNPLSELIRKNGYSVTNTNGEDLDIDYTIVQKTKIKVLTSFEIFEHLVSPFNVLKESPATYLVATVPLKLWFAPAYRSKVDLRDKHFHEFEDWQFDWLLDKAGWQIIDSEKWISPTKINGIRPLLRNFTPRYYAVYAERK